MDNTGLFRSAAPLPVAKLYEAMYLEDEPRQHVRKIIDLFETTIHYLVLLGLSIYTYYEIKDAKVEEARSELKRPSLGSWVKLLTRIDQSLRTNSLSGILLNPDQFQKSGFVFEAFQSLASILDKKPQGKIKLNDFFSSLVQFRNEKFGHGNISRAEANLITEAIERGVTQWITETKILFESNLTYIDRVEWRGTNFYFFGTNLNCGTYLYPLRLERDRPVTPRQIYLFEPSTETFFPLYPYFAYDEANILYLYDKISDKNELILKCPYESHRPPGILYLSHDESIITGKANGMVDESSSIEKESDSMISNRFQQITLLIQQKMSEAWLTDSQREVWSKVSSLMGPPYYVLNIYGKNGSGKTFIALLLQKYRNAVYVEANDINWDEIRGKKLIILDNYDSSRRAVRSLQAQLDLFSIGQIIILTQYKAQDDIPCLHLPVTERDIQLVKANLYRELELIIPEGDYRNLWDCLKHLEEEP